MNYRIKELIKQAKDWAYADHDGYTAQMLFEQKFAELIVRECADISNQAEKQCQHPGTMIKQHFGVRE